tara:strand:- start:739 stop:912 length:174 start_codon:yes stop_codon:yes gene_type:complete
MNTINDKFTKEFFSWINLAIRRKNKKKNNSTETFIIALNLKNSAVFVRKIEKKEINK